MFKDIRQDSAQHMPQRLNVIVRWGKRVAYVVLGVLLFALAGAWVALRGRRPANARNGSGAMLPYASRITFYGAMALAISFLR